jgi:hypothetical protein
MANLLSFALDAHGGAARWAQIQSVSACLAIGGALWDLKGKTGILADALYEADIHVQRATLGRFTAPDRQVRFTPQQLVLETATGEAIETRDNPRAAFAGHSFETPWDDLHVAYFSGYAMWTYLTQPFLYEYPGFVTREIEPWREDDETWRRLEVTFPDQIASHTRTQITYFGPDGLMRRHDYAVDVLGGAGGAHYIGAYQTVDGVRVPTRRRVFPHGSDNRKVPEPVLVSIDLADIHFR